MEETTRLNQAELNMLMAFNLGQYRECSRSKSDLLKTCHLLKEEIKVDGMLRGHIMTIQSVLNGTFKEDLESMMLSYDDPINAGYQLIAKLYQSNLSESELLGNVEDALMLETLSTYYNGDKEAFYDFLHVLTDKIETMGDAQ